MGSSPQGELTQKLRQANVNLRCWLASLVPAAKPGPVTPQQMDALLSQLLRAGQWLRELPRPTEPELQTEVGEYRRNVEQLHDLLPFIHMQLIKERARLEAERTRLESAAEWVQRSRQTL